MVNMLVLVPIDAVVKLGSDETISPWSDQVIVRGSSPLLTMHKTDANSPSSNISFPNVSGFKAGGSVMNFRG